MFGSVLENIRYQERTYSDLRGSFFAAVMPNFGGVVGNRDTAIRNALGIPERTPSALERLADVDEVYGAEHGYASVRKTDEGILYWRQNIFAKDTSCKILDPQNKEPVYVCIDADNTDEGPYWDRKVMLARVKILGITLNHLLPYGIIPLSREAQQAYRRPTLKIRDAA